MCVRKLTGVLQTVKVGFAIDHLRRISRMRLSRTASEIGLHFRKERNGPEVKDGWSLAAGVQLILRGKWTDESQDTLPTLAVGRV